MKKEKKALIVFPDEWLQYSPSVLNMYRCCSELYDTKLIYVDNEKFNNTNLVENFTKIDIWKITAYLSRKTIGYKFYKIIRLFFTLLFIKLTSKRYDLVIAIDSSGFAVTKLFFSNTVYFSLETEKDNYFKFCELLGIETLIIQSKERKEFLIGNTHDIQVFYIQNSPILNPRKHVVKEKKHKRILYMGNIDFGYGLEQFIDCIGVLNEEYSLTLKGIKNEKFYNHLQHKYQTLINSQKVIFDFNYVEQEKIIEYTSSFYIGVTGYDLELAKQSFNYFSSPAGKLFNYYAAAIPVIGIDIIGLKSVKDFKTGVLINEVTPENISNAIYDIEADYNTYGTNCLKASQEFDFKKSCNIFLETISSNYTNPDTLINSIKKFNVKTFFTKGRNCCN